MTFAPHQTPDYIEANFDPGDPTLGYAGTGRVGTCPEPMRALIAEVCAKAHRLQMEQAALHVAEVEGRRVWRVRDEEGLQ